jgi:hypothetical protein
VSSNAVLGAHHRPMTITSPLRDDLTKERLEAAGAHLAGVQVLDFSADWWDGQSHAPCLVVRGGRRDRLLRIVETGGECIILPFAQRVAQRWLAERRRPQRVELVVPLQRRVDDIVLEVDADVLRCTSATCGALLPLGHDGACPVCGGWGEDSDEKSTATG